jgi:hypothetical protein
LIAATSNAPNARGRPGTRARGCSSCEPWWASARAGPADTPRSGQAARRPRSAPRASPPSARSRVRAGTPAAGPPRGPTPTGRGRRTALLHEPLDLRRAQVGRFEILRRHPTAQVGHQLQQFGCRPGPVPAPEQLLAKARGVHRQRPGQLNPQRVAHLNSLPVVNRRQSVVPSAASRRSVPSG